MSRKLLLCGLILGSSGCGGAVIEPGHRGLLFDPHNGGLAREVLAPGYHKTPMSARVDDFDVTYSSKTESLHAITSEGLPVDVEVSLVYRPIIAELYELDTELGRHYYDEVLGPELLSAARGCMARHSYAELPKMNEKLEDEVEADVRRRVLGKHVEIASVVFEGFQMPPELASAVKDREIAAQIAMKRKLEEEQAWEREKLAAQHKAELRRIERGGEGAR